MMNMRFKGTLRLPKVNFQDDLKVIAKDILIPDMIKGIHSGTDIDDKAFPANDYRTISRKRGSKVLVDTGKLLNSFQSKTKGKFNVVISLKNIRKNIGGYLQLEGIRSRQGLKKFKFFGIRKAAEKLAMKYMENRIRKAIQNV